MAENKTLKSDEKEALSSRRKFLKKAAYVPPTMIALGAFTSPKVGAQSHNVVGGEPPPPPG